MKLMEQAVQLKGPCYVRLGRSAVPINYLETDEIVIGKANTLREGNDATIVATGIMVYDALQAADQLLQEGVAVRVIDMHTIKPLDEKTLLAAAKETKHIVTAEEHSVIGGLGGAVAEFLAFNCPTHMAFVGQHDTFGESGKPDQLKEKYGMTADDIVKAVKHLINK